MSFFINITLIRKELQFFVTDSRHLLYLYVWEDIPSIRHYTCLYLWHNIKVHISQLENIFVMRPLPMTSRSTKRNHVKQRLNMKIVYPNYHLFDFVILFLEEYNALFALEKNQTDLIKLAFKIVQWLREGLKDLEIALG